MEERDVIGSFVNRYPRETMRIVIVCMGLVWQTIPAILGFGIYALLERKPTAKTGVMIAICSFIALCCYLFQAYWMQDYTLAKFVWYGWVINKSVWQGYWHGEWAQTTFMQLVMGFNYLFSVPPLIIAGLLGVDLLPVNAHKQTLAALQQGREFSKAKELSAKEIEQAMSRLPAHVEQGTVLGVSMTTGQPSILDDKAVNQVVLVLGTTGAGKTVTLRRFIDRAIHKHYPLIIVDGKPSDDNVAWVKQLAEKSGQPFFGFNCGNYHHYDPLADGGFTELKDKIISLKDHWENDYYLSIAEDYLQTTLEILLKSGSAFDLSKVVSCLNFDELVALVRTTKDKALMERVKGLEHYERKDITGLQAHLNLLLNSELGDYFRIDDHTFTLRDVIDKNGIVYFALPALRFPSFSRVLGKLVVNDIKAVIDRYQGEKKIFTIFDEFSVFAGEQVLNLVNMGRGKGVHAIFGTQGLADLEKVEATFKDQIMNCANTLICHRLNDQNSAESVANWIGTMDAYTLTAQLDTKTSDAGLGSVRVNKEFVVHPDEIKRGLKTGEAYLISKLGRFSSDKARIINSIGT